MGLDEAALLLKSDLGGQDCRERLFQMAEVVNRNSKGVSTLYRGQEGQEAGSEASGRCLARCVVSGECLQLIFCLWEVYKPAYMVSFVLWTNCIQCG